MLCALFLALAQPLAAGLFHAAVPVAAWLRRECSGWPDAAAGAAAFDAVVRGTGAEVLFCGRDPQRGRGGFKAAGFGTVGGGSPASSPATGWRVAARVSWNAGGNLMATQLTLRLSEQDARTVDLLKQMTGEETTVKTLLV